MRPWRAGSRVLATGTVTLLVVVLAPAVLLFGELVNRRYLRGLRIDRDRVLVRRRGWPGRRGTVVIRRALRGLPPTRWLAGTAGWPGGCWPTRSGSR